MRRTPSNPVIVKIAINGTESEVFDMRRFAGGNFCTPAALTGTKVTFLLASERDGTYLEARENGAAVEVDIAADGWYQLPSIVETAGFVKLKSNATELAERSFTIHAKS